MMKDKREILYTTLGGGSLAFAFFWLPVPRLFDVACYLLILLFVSMAMAPSNRDLRQDPVIKLGFFFFLYILISIAWHRLTLPDHFPDTTSDRRFLRVLYFIGIAYAITRSHFLTPWRVLGAAFAGLLVYLLATFDPAEWARAWQGGRVDLGMQNAQHTGVVFFTWTLALTVFTPRFYRWAKSLPKRVAALCAAFWLAAWLLSVWGMLIAQTRAVWLGLCVTLLLLPVVLGIVYLLRGRPQLSLRRPLMAAAACIVLLGLLGHNLDVPELVRERLASEQVTWESLRQAATHEESDLSSIEIRVASWAAATGWIMERPLMGWGGRGSRPLIQNSDLFSESFKAQFNHLHNSYFQILVEVGVIGALFIIVLITLVGRATLKAYKEQRMPLDVFLFAWLFFLFWLVVSFFESYIIYPSGTYLVAIVAGLTYSYCIERKSQMA